MKQVKVGELKGRRNIIRIECSCSSTAVWIARGNKRFDARERREFIEQHRDHKLKLLQTVGATLWYPA